jgi:phenylalanyl-tRNA synthetase beta chain
MHPGRCASVWLDDRCIGHVGELHPRWRQGYEVAQAPVLFELELDAVLDRPVPTYQAVSRHQAVERDLAIVVKESVTHAAVLEAIRAPASPWLRDVVLFDVYRPKKQTSTESTPAGSLAADEKSLAVRLVLNRDDATLTEEDIDATVNAAVEAVAQRVAGRLRA